jgi:CDP-diglyceride synthetase
MSLAGFALGAVGVVWGVVAIVRSRSAEDAKQARNERLLGVFWIVSGLIIFGLAIVAASQNGD